MIIKSFDTKNIKNSKSNIYLFHGKNEGLKEELIQNVFLKDFNGETIRYDESEILNNKESFFENCLNESLFENNQIIIISRTTNKLYETIKDLYEKNIHNKKVILDANILEKKSKIRQFFEKESKLVSVAIYEDNNSSLFKIANDYFRSNKISISSESINLIIDKCSGDRKNLQNEIGKILNFCHEKNKISREEILKLINLYEDESYFNLVDNCLAKNHLKVCKIINNNNFGKEDSIILIRSFILRLKRLLELKKLQIQVGGLNETISNFKPPIFWKDKEIVQKQIETWSIKKIYDLLEKVSYLELNLKKNSSLSNNLVFDLILNTSNS